MGVIKVHIELDITSREAAVMRAALAGHLHTVENEDQKNIVKGIYDLVMAQEKAQRRLWAKRQEELKK